MNEKDNLNHEELKQKISTSLQDLNKSTFVFDEMIQDYNLLHKKYDDLQKLLEQNQRLNTTKKEDVSKKENKNDEEDYNFLKDKYFKLKETNEQNLQEIRNNLENIMKLKEKIDIQDKKIKGYQAENSALKSQNMQLDRKNKELNKIKEENEKIIVKLNKACQRMEIDHKKLIDDSVQTHQDLENLRNKILDMQTNRLNDNLGINSDEININKNYTFNKNDINFSIKNTSKELPNKLKYKQKIHHKGITSITFNKVGTKYVTTGEDKSLIILDTIKNLEIKKFCDFNKTVSEACFNKKNHLIFAGSYDASAKLFSTQNYRLISDFCEHAKQINCVKSYHTKERGLTGSSDTTIKEWDFESKKLLQEFSYNSACYCLNISSNDYFILSGHEDGAINMWIGDMNKKSKVYKLHKDKILDVEIIRDNSFISLGRDRVIKLFDTRKEKEIYTINEEKINDICESNIAISPDKNHFAVGSKEGNVYIFNLNKGELENTINNNNGRGEVKSICWSEYNNHIYVGDSNGFISIWGNDTVF